MTALVYATHRLHPRAEAAIGRLAEIGFASALDAQTLAREANRRTSSSCARRFPTLFSTQQGG
jgi:hypothetical protein